MSDDEGYVMRDYYEVLKVAEDCAENDIRRAYKKAALRCHPDKNVGREEEAALEFKEVQQAYSVLIDEKERAWYDAHKDQILRGDTDGGQAPDEVNLFNYCTPRAYEGFSDKGKGFFNIYNTVFKTIYEEEQKDWKMQQAQPENKGSKQKLRPCPMFGTSEDSYDDVVGPFYAFWSDYTTKKSFSWKDEYKAHEMPDRFQRRKAEQINQKERQAARTEYNKLVQDLVAFVKRRDPRVAKEEERREALEAEKADEQMKKDIEKGKRQAAANQRLWEEMAAEEALREAEEEERFQRMLAAGEIDEHGQYIGMDELQEKRRQQEEKEKAEAEAEKAAAAAVVYYCIACGATFKGAAWAAHCNSKKHRANLKTFTKKNGAKAEWFKLLDHVDDAESAASPTTTASPASPASPPAASDASPAQGEDQEEEDESEDDSPTMKKKDKKKKKNKNVKLSDASFNRFGTKGVIKGGQEDSNALNEKQANAGKKSKKGKRGKHADSDSDEDVPAKKQPQTLAEPVKMSKKQKKQAQQAAAREQLRGNTMPTKDGKSKKDEFASSSEEEDNADADEEEEEEESEEETTMRPTFGGGGFGALGKKGRR